MKSILQINKTNYFLTLAIIVMISLYIQKKYVIFPQICSMDVPDEVRTSILNNIKKWDLLSYPLSFLMLLIRMSYTSLCLYLGSLFAEETVKWKEHFNVALKADVVLVLYTVLTSMLCIFFSREEIAEIISNASLLAFVDIEKVQPVLLSLLGSFNIFELAYWVFMALLLKTVRGKRFIESMQFVISTYGIGFIIYLLFIVFVTLYVTQQ